MHGVFESGIASQEQGLRPDPLGLCDRVQQQLAAHSKAAELWRDRHFRQLVNPAADRNQCDAANSLIVEAGHEDIATPLEDLVFRITQGFAIRLLQREITGDPLFIQDPEGRRVLPGMEWSNLDFRKTGRRLHARHLHLVIMHFYLSLTAVCSRRSITSNILFLCIKICQIWIAISNCVTFVTSLRLQRSCTLAAPRSASILLNRPCPNKFASWRSCWDIHSSTGLRAPSA